MEEEERDEFLKVMRALRDAARNVQSGSGSGADDTAPALHVLLALDASKDDLLAGDPELHALYRLLAMLRALSWSLESCGEEAGGGGWLFGGLRARCRRCEVRRGIPKDRCSKVVNMLHHSNSRHQRNRGSKIKTLLKATLLLCVAVWLVYQVKHSYDKKNEYLNATDNQLSHDDRSMFQGRKERVGSYVGDVDKAVENIDVISNQDEEKSGETVFDKDNTDSHDDDVGNTERSEAEEGQTSCADGNAEAHDNDEDETTGHSAALKLDAPAF